MRFRRFACVLAGGLGIDGSVRTHGRRVEIVATSDPARVALFLRRLLSEHPPVARPEMLSAESCAAPAE